MMPISNDILNKNLYATLGVENTASEQEIIRAYRVLARKHHPDKNPDNKEAAEKRFKDISEAHEILTDKNVSGIPTRKEYDLYSPHGQHNDAKTSYTHANRNHDATTQTNTHAARTPPTFAKPKTHESPAAETELVVTKSDLRGLIQRRPSFASSTSTSHQTPTQQTELSSTTLTGAKGADYFGKVTMGVGLATWALGGAGLMVIGALISLAANSVKNIEKAGLASDVLKKHNAGAEVNPKLLDEANSVMHSNSM